MELPEAFFHADQDGSRGIAEWAFMSTTASKQTALQYSGVVENRPLATVLVIRASTIDKGASISDFSQYPSENEYIWPPCSFLEPEGSSFLNISAEGIVRMIPVRVNANLKSQTLEEIVSQKKATHLSSLRYRIDEIKIKFEKYKTEFFEDKLLQQRLVSKGIASCTHISAFVDKITAECEDLFLKHQMISDEVFNTEENYRSLVTEMLEITVFAQSKIDLWRLDSSWGLMNVDSLRLRMAHRLTMDFKSKQVWKFHGEQREKLALEICKDKGLVVNSIDEYNELGECPVLRAAAEGGTELDFTLLQAAGGDLQSKSKAGGKSAVQLAAEGGHTHSITALHTLFQKDLMINDIDFHGWSPLMSASCHGHVKCVRELLALLASPLHQDGAGRTALHVAAESGHTAVLKVLVERGSNLECTDLSGKTGVWYAGFGAYVDAVQFLCDKGAKISNALDGASSRGSIFVWEVERVLPQGYTSEERHLMETAGYRVDDILQPFQFETDRAFRFAKDDLVGIERTDETIRVAKILSDMSDPHCARVVLVNETQRLTKSFSHCGVLFKISTYAYTVEESRAVRGRFDVGQALGEDQVLGGRFFYRISDFVGVRDPGGSLVVGCVSGRWPDGGGLKIAVQSPVLTGELAGAGDLRPAHPLQGIHAGTEVLARDPSSVCKLRI